MQTTEQHWLTGVTVKSIDFPFSYSYFCHYAVAPLSKNAKHFPSFSPLQGVSRGRVNILGDGSMDSSE